MSGWQCHPPGAVSPEAGGRPGLRGTVATKASDFGNWPPLPGVAVGYVLMRKDGFRLSWCLFSRSAEPLRPDPCRPESSALPGPWPRLSASAGTTSNCWAPFIASWAAGLLDVNSSLVPSPGHSEVHVGPGHRGCCVAVSLPGSLCQTGGLVAQLLALSALPASPEGSRQTPLPLVISILRPELPQTLLQAGAAPQKWLGVFRGQLSLLPEPTFWLWSWGRDSGPVPLRVGPGWPGPGSGPLRPRRKPRPMSVSLHRTVPGGSGQRAGGPESLLLASTASACGCGPGPRPPTPTPAPTPTSF